MISKNQRHQLLIADRFRDVEIIGTAVAHALATSDCSLLDIEMVFRNAAASSYIVAGEAGSYRIVITMTEWIAALAELGRLPAENRELLKQSLPRHQLAVSPGISSPPPP